MSKPLRFTGDPRLTIGCMKRHSRETYVVQTNNPTEEFIRKGSDPMYRVACGPSAAYAAILAMGGHYRSRNTDGWYKVQPEEVLTDAFNDPRNYPALREIRKDIDPEDYRGNTVPQYYPYIVNGVFGAQCEFSFGVEEGHLITALKKGQAIQVCLNPEHPSGSGHFVTIVGMDSDGDFIYNDPYPTAANNHDGFNLVMLRETMLERLRQYKIVYTAVKNY